GGHRLLDSGVLSPLECISIHRSAILRLPCASPAPPLHFPHGRTRPATRVDTEDAVRTGRRGRLAMRARAAGPAGVVRFALLVPLLAACASAPGARPGAPPLRQVADSAVAAPPLDRTHWGIEVYDPEQDRVLYR